MNGFGDANAIGDLLSRVRALESASNPPFGRQFNVMAWGEIAVANNTLKGVSHGLLINGVAVTPTLILLQPHFDPGTPAGLVYVVQTPNSQTFAIVQTNTPANSVNFFWFAAA